MGSLALDLAWTAAGRYDAFFYECGLELWDFGAGEVICAESGLDVARVPSAPPYSPAILVAPPGWRRFALTALGINGLEVKV
jgi:myo-inositol-1(or 4)-monophosphatase